MQVLERLSTYLPEEQRSRQALLDLAHSPQFQQQLSTFSGALPLVLLISHTSDRRTVTKTHLTGF
jgi:hypothetical protein